MLNERCWKKHKRIYRVAVVFDVLQVLKETIYVRMIDEQKSEEKYNTYFKKGTLRMICFFCCRLEF